MLSFFPRGVLDEILNLIESVSEDFPSYSSYDLIREFTMTLYASDIVSSYVAYQNNIKALHCDMPLNNMQK